MSKLHGKGCYICTKSVGFMPFCHGPADIIILIQVESNIPPSSSLCEVVRHLSQLRAFSHKIQIVFAMTIAPTVIGVTEL